MTALQWAFTCYREVQGVFNYITELRKLYFDKRAKLNLTCPSVLFYIPYLPYLPA